MAKNKTNSLFVFRFLKRISPILFMAGMILMDTAVVPVLFRRSIYIPSFVLASVIAMRMQKGFRWGVLYGVIGGLLIDISTNNPVGMYTITLLAAASATSLTNLFKKTLGKMIIVTLIYLIYETVFFAMAYASTIRFETWYLLPALVRIILGIALFALMRYLMIRNENTETENNSRRRILHVTLKRKAA